MPKPFLSIGIIFKNEIRCLERCLSSLAPLRKALPCELVMADTGSNDGSREVAEKYADILIDFPWINDFSAARNAVMDRCSGRWYLSLDADEWLDGDIKELTQFLRTNNSKTWDGCMLRVRNYMGEIEKQDYADFFAMRILRMSTGLRYQGAIHELWKYGDGRIIRAFQLEQTILHHDGYVNLNTPEGEAKRIRNRTLLLEKLEKDPGNVRLLLQYIESSRPDSDHMEYIQRGIDAVESKHSEWSAFGPVIFRYAVLAAKELDLPQFSQWTARAEELFPNSFYTQIDINCYRFMYHWERQEYVECIPCGERYLAAVADCEAGRGDRSALLYSTLHTMSPWWQQTLRTGLASACQQAGRPGRAVELLEEFETLDGSIVKALLESLWELQTTTDQDTSAHILRLYQRIAGEPDGKRAEELMTVFLQTAPLAFGPDVREKEAAREDFRRHSYTLYLPLAGQCEAGTAAAVMESEGIQELDRLLGMVKNWGDFSVSALIHALERGAAFPPAGRTMGMEEMERIARRLAQYKDRFFSMVGQTASRQCGGSWQQLLWARTAVLAAVQAFDWKDQRQGMALAEAFGKVMGAFVSRCYTPEVLCEENIQILPPVHQFGWYSGRAFQALESGDSVAYVKLLRAGLERCPEMKIMVEFLTEHTPQLRPSASQEFLSLAEQVRGMLSAFAPDDPAVAALKQSPIYQKVVHLIEGIEAPVTGGLPQ